MKKSGGVVMRGKSTKLSLSCAVFLFLCMLACVVCVASAKTIYVPDDYEKIQWAVDNASADDTIIVRDGTYYESIIVNEKLAIKSENGPENCIVNGTGSDVFTLEADGIRIEGFTITGGGYGIYIRSNNNTIINNIIITNRYQGIYLNCSNNNTIINNNISSNDHDGIDLYWDSSNNYISNNNISSNDYGIHLYKSNNNSISNNNISSNDHDGIWLLDSNNNSISNNNISSNDDEGIDLRHSNNNTIINNNISSNDDEGIDLRHSNNNTIRINEFMNDGLLVDNSYNNTVEDNTVNGKPLVYLEDESDRIIDDAGQVILVRCKNITIMNSELTNTDIGIELWQSDNCLISNSNISSNDYGIVLYYSSNNYISYNNISSNDDEGIELWDSNNNSISNNNISSNDDEGIELWDSNNNSISNNNISSNDYGIYLFIYSNNNSISNNNISSNDYGIVLWYSNNNIIYLNNFIDNTDNVCSEYSTNIWNSTEKITYTYNGSQHTNYLGNYWSDYTGNDSDGDGIGDTPYSIDSDKDNYPLMERFEYYIGVAPAPNQPPIANFTYSPEKPVVNQSVTFDASSSYDPDGKIMNYEWDFGDGNITNTTEKVIKHLYSEAGSYEVTLTVKDDKGATNSTTKMVTVQLAQPSVSISTDKYEYTAGDVMLINITIKNPSERKGVKFLWRLDIHDYNLSFTVINNKSILLPPEFKKTFVISWRLPKLRASFNASWYVALYDGIISEDTADWRYICATKKEEREIARDVAELREIERSVLQSAKLIKSQTKTTFSA